MSSDSLISIIMPAYNAQSFIGSAIESVCSQNYQNWELLVINDGSTDDTANIVESFGQKDLRIKLIHNTPENKGVSGARNLGISQASGVFLAFLDADDLWLPEKLQEQYTFMLHKNIDFCFTYYQKINSSNEKKGVIKAPVSVNYHQLLFGNPIGCSTVMLNISQIGKHYFPKSQRHEDYVLWLDILKETDKAFSYPKVMTLYRTSQDSLSSNKLKAAKWQWQIYRNVLNLNLAKSTYFFVFYAINALNKYVK